MWIPSRRAVLAAGAAVVAELAVSACAGNASGAPAADPSGKPVRGGTLKYRAAGGTASNDPASDTGYGLAVPVRAVVDSLAKSIAVLCEGCFEVVKEVQSAEKQSDREEVRIEQECLRVLALYEPVASDLRRLATRRLCVRTSSVRSRRVTSSGVARKSDE